MHGASRVCVFACASLTYYFSGYKGAMQEQVYSKYFVHFHATPTARLLDVAA